MAREPWSARARGFFRLLPIALLALAFGAPASAQGSSGWDLCNQTSFVLEAATGRPENQQSVIVEGWTRIRPGECKAALDAPVTPGFYFVFARSSKAHRGGEREWKGATPLCIDPNGSFAVPSQNKEACASMGLEPRDFQRVRLDKPSGSRMTFHETERFNKGGQTAANAGLQRLLDDAGVSTDNKVVDGYLGRESRASIASFLSEHKLPAAMANDAAQLIDTLEDVARNRSLEVGMMLCNRTENRITAAVARRRPDGWESRGWWTMDAGLCVRTMDESLIAAPHYVFAEMETPQGVRPLNGAQTVFCTARSKFAILGRDDCEKRRFRQATFLETAIPEDGKLVYEFFDRAFGPPQKKQP